MACKMDGLVELGDPQRAAPFFRLAAQRNVSRHEQRYLARAPSVRNAPLTFAVGSTAVVGLSFGTALALVSPAVSVGVITGTFLGGALTGLGIARLAPRWLLGRNEKLSLARELEALAAQNPVVPAARFEGPVAGLETWAGELVGSPAPSPFAPEPVLAAHATGRYGALDVDDAWLAPGGLAIRPEALDGGPPRVEVALDPDAGIWLRTDDEDASPPLELWPEIEAFFAIRGGRVEGDARATAKDALRVALLRPGDRVLVTGRPSVRQVSDGYRGSREVVALEPPHVLSLAR